MNISLFQHVPHLDKLLITKHLTVMLKTGIPIAEILDTLSEDVKSPYFKKVLAKIKSDTQNGQSLAVSFKKHPQVFSNMYVNLISIGEETGELEKNLEYLTTQMEKEYALKKKIQGALFYPLFILIASLIMGTVIALFVLPQLTDLFKGFDIELPFTTRALLFLANVFKRHGIVIVASGVGIVVGLGFLLRIPSVYCNFQKFQLHLPVIGPIVRSYQLAQFTRNLGILLGGGVPISKAFPILSESLTNCVYRDSMKIIATEVKKGKSVADIIDSNNLQRLYPTITRKMIRVGNKTGKLEESLLYLGNFYESEVDSISKNLSTLLEPVMLVIIGLVVAFLALSIISPVYEFVGSIG